MVECQFFSSAPTVSTFLDEEKQAPDEVMKGNQGSFLFLLLFAEMVASCLGCNV